MEPKVKVTCLSIDCPERQGRECMYAIHETELEIEVLEELAAKAFPA
jgi:hypothetical protein